MNRAARTYQLAKILTISQLRSRRSESGKSRIWDRPAFIMGADALAISLSWFVSFEILSLMPSTLDSSINTLARQVLAFLPLFVLALVLLAGIVFELNASSNFGSSDLVNWLPVSKSVYVAASASSVAWVYSPYLAVTTGVTLALAIQAQLVSAWIASFALSTILLLTGGFLIEILRASINRVYSVMSKRTGRATLVVRLALVIIVLIAFQAVFNPNLLFQLVNGFGGALNTAFFVPLVWPSLMVLAVIAGDVSRSIIFGSLSMLFVVLVFLIAVTVRSKYWSPSPAAIGFTSNHGYSPHYSRLGSFGFSGIEASILTKDFKGYVRQKELIPYLAMPFVLTAVLALQQFTGPSGGSHPQIPWMLAWFAGFVAIFLSSSSIGMEGKSFLNMYTMPLKPKEILLAKASSSLLLSLAGALLMTLVATVLSFQGLVFVLEMLLVGVMVSIQSVFLGLGFATRYSDFTVRPKPRYISPRGTFSAILIGTAALLITSAPILLLFESQPYLSLLISFISFTVVTILAYRYSLKGAGALMVEMKN
jgi:hypothetical protein